MGETAKKQDLQPEAQSPWRGFATGLWQKDINVRSLWMTLGFSDGRTLYAVRYASSANAPTLCHSRDIADVYRLNPALKTGLSSATRMIISEPT